MTCRSLADPAPAYEGPCTFEFGWTAQLFSLERPELGVPWYDFAMCALERWRRLLPDRERVVRCHHVQEPS
jgi:hypothetical protein